MSDTRIKFLEWQLFPNRKETISAYDKVEKSSAESCGCTYCQNFIKQRNKVFPIEIIQLFDQLGINYKKEVEISQFAEQENGLHIYGGWFQYQGTFSGKDCTIRTSDSGYSLDLTKISDSFCIGFRYDNSLSIFDKNQSIVQIEFECQIPWTLN